jgi:hypothetical protein
MSTPEASHFSRHYSLDQARALLPEIRRWLATLDTTQEHLRDVEERLTVLLASHDDIGGEPVNELARTLADCKEILQEFASRQIQIKDVERGLIDFPSWRDGREIFLCWEKDEPDIEFWHDVESGYAGRERL